MRIRLIDLNVYIAINFQK